MQVPIFQDAIQDNSLADLMAEVKAENVRKDFSQVQEREIPEGFDREAIEEEERPEHEEVEEFRQAPPPAIKKPFMPYDEQAEMLVTAFDSIQQLSLPALAKKINFTPEEKKDLKSIKRKRQIDKQSLTDEEKLLFEKWVMLKDFEDELPFTDKEIKFLVNPLAKLLEQQQAEMKPGQALMVAAATISLPRVAMFMALKYDISEMEVKKPIETEPQSPKNE